MNLSNKSVLLTGATGGIGQEVAKALAQQNTRLILVGRNQDKLDAFTNELDGDHQVIQADITSTQGRQKVSQQAKLIGVDMLINLAGVNCLSLLTQTTDEELNGIIQTNLVAPMLLTRDMIPILKQQQQAMIVNVGSTFGSIGFAGSTVYCASKFGLRGFTEALRRELTDSIIKVVYIAPRATKTAMNSEQTDGLNEVLGNKVDTPERVASIIVETLKKPNPHNQFIGWPEKLFIRINAILPKVVDKSLDRQVSIIRHYAQR